MEKQDLDQVKEVLKFIEHNNKNFEKLKIYMVEGCKELDILPPEDEDLREAFTLMKLSDIRKSIDTLDSKHNNTAGSVDILSFKYDEASKSIDVLDSKYKDLMSNLISLNLSVKELKK